MSNTASGRDSIDLKHFAYLSLGALGVVFGDIGTSPLYAVRECFYGAHAAAITHDNVLGVLSLITWSLILVIIVKYLLYIMRADNRGEGGELALMALASGSARGGRVSRSFVMVSLGLFGAALLYGDGMITPAVSVLSAVEGLKVATPFFEPYVVPITIAILLCLFFVQSRGTGKIGAVFGPIIFVWFVSIGIFGARSVITQPEVLNAINPYYGVNLLLTDGWHGFIILGAVFLAVTGGEALFADMGHFGRLPIQLCWFSIVFPALLLNYYGQGALLLDNPSNAENPFFFLIPEALLYPMVGLATLATVIASQAVISGAFSITRQAISLGYAPRLAIRHTSSDEIGQVYVPQINWMLCIATIWLVLEFQSSSRLASAYGMAVSTTMVIATILTYFVTRRVWQWGFLRAALVTCPILIIDFAFFSANVIKIPHGGWVPLLVGVVMFTLLSTWGRGREIVTMRLRESLRPLDRFIEQIKDTKPTRVPGVSIFMVRTPEGTPPALIHNLKHNKVLHHRVIVLSILIDEVPHIEVDDRVEIEHMGEGVFRAKAWLGYMDHPNVPEILAEVNRQGLVFDISEAIFFLGRETLLATTRPGMALWRERLFAFMSRNAQSAMAFFNIPTEQVVEIGLQVEL